MVSGFWTLVLITAQQAFHQLSCLSYQKVFFFLEFFKFYFGDYNIITTFAPFLSSQQTFSHTCLWYLSTLWPLLSLIVIECIYIYTKNSQWDLKHQIKDRERNKQNTITSKPWTPWYRAVLYPHICRRWQLICRLPQQPPQGRSRSCSLILLVASPARASHYFCLFP